MFDFVLCSHRISLKNMPADSMRFQPFGEDSRGNRYWYFNDTRLYREISTKSNE